MMKSTTTIFMLVPARHLLHLDRQETASHSTISHCSIKMEWISPPKTEIMTNRQDSTALLKELGKLLSCTALYLCALSQLLSNCTVIVQCKTELLYCIYCIVQYYTALYCFERYCTVLFCTALQCTIQCCAVLHCTKLYCTPLHCTVL